MDPKGYIKAFSLPTASVSLNGLTKPNASTALTCVKIILLSVIRSHLPCPPLSDRALYYRHCRVHLSLYSRLLRHLPMSAILCILGSKRIRRRGFKAQRCEVMTFAVVNALMDSLTCLLPLSMLC